MSTLYMMCFMLDVTVYGYVIGEFSPSICRLDKEERKHQEWFMQTEKQPLHVKVFNAAVEACSVSRKCFVLFLRFSFPK